MKHKYDTITAAVCMLLIAVMMCGAAPRGNAWTEKQVWAHNTAEDMRAMGYDEGNPIIVECQRIWREEENAKTIVRFIDEGPNNGANRHLLKYLGEYRITGYDTCAACCGKTDGITASGAVATVGRTCAASGFPFGTVLYIEGIGMRVVEDRGVGAGVIDVLCNDHAECYDITGRYDVYVVEDGA